MLRSWLDAEGSYVNHDYNVIFFTRLVLLPPLLSREETEVQIVEAA